MYKVLATIAICISLLSCSNGVENKNLSENGDLKENTLVSLPQYNIEFEVPNDWKYEELKGGMIFQANCSDSIKYCPNIAINGNIKNYEEDLNEYSTDFINQMNKEYKLSKIKKQEQKIDGKVAVNVRYNVEMKNLNHVGSATFIQIDSVLLNISYLGVEPIKGISAISKEDMYNKLIASIKEI